MSGIRELNPFLYLGKVALGRLTNPAWLSVNYTRLPFYKKDLTQIIFDLDLFLVGERICNHQIPEGVDPKTVHIIHSNLCDDKDSADDGLVAKPSAGLHVGYHVKQQSEDVPLQSAGT